MVDINVRVTGVTRCPALLRMDRRRLFGLFFEFGYALHEEFLEKDNGRGVLRLFQPLHRAAERCNQILARG